MNSLAMTDSLLLVVTFLIAIGAKYPPSIRIAAGLFAAAACLGVLRFTGVLPLPTMHSGRCPGWAWRTMPRAGADAAGAFR